MARSFGSLAKDTILTRMLERVDAESHLGLTMGGDLLHEAAQALERLRGVIDAKRIDIEIRAGNDGPKREPGIVNVLIQQRIHDATDRADGREGDRAP